VSWLAFGALMVFAVSLCAIAGGVLLLLEDYLRESWRAREYKRRHKNEHQR